MRKLMTIATCALALPLPATLAAASAAATRSATTTKALSRKVIGADALAGQWGSVQVVVTLTTHGTGKGAKRVYTDLGGQYTYHTSRSEFVMSQALPILRQEFLAAQSSRIQLVSGATFTSNAFEQSLQSALLKASK